MSHATVNRLEISIRFDDKCFVVNSAWPSYAHTDFTRLFYYWLTRHSLGSIDTREKQR